jgi:hypothetical protein
MKWIGWIMKHLCCNKVIFLLVFISGVVFASLTDKSAVFYYQKNISYPTVGVHDYIVVEPKNTNIYTHGFSLYNDKIYARVEINKFKTNYKQRVKHLLKDGYKNFFFDVAILGDKKKDFIEFLSDFHQQYPTAKIMLKAKEDMRGAYASIEAFVIDSYLKNQFSLKYLKDLNVDIIDIEHKKISDVYSSKKLVDMLKSKGIIPYITNNSFDIYGLSSKQAIKREVLTLIDESKHDRAIIPAHQNGALIFEYMGYIQKLYDVSKGLPDIEHMRHYAGVVIWLNIDYKNPRELMKWVLSLKKIGIKVVFANSFGSEMDSTLLKELDIDIYDGDTSLDNKKHVVYQDEMIGFEIEPSLSDSTLYIQPHNAKPLLTYKDKNGLTSTPVAITSWGGYALYESFMLELNDENIWIINPFKFFAQALRLKPLAVPDPTTENGKRIFFTHVDGDGIMNYVESNPELVSGDVILNKILKPYKIPHSVSVIGAEIDDDGLYPKLAKRLQRVAKKMYALPNVEPATHTFTHPFFWNKIKNGDLSPKYRLKPKGYKFSLDREIRGALEDITKNLLPKGSKKKAQSVFWSGDCIPTEMVLDNVYKNHILNINGGYTIINNASPWLSFVAPLGLGKGEYYQIYTGAQNENVFTNDWLGPFWGFKKVIQTFKLTNSPRRLKPIDVYYHLYSGSKVASINAVKYVLDWVIKQDVMPIYTSEYIPKVMDFYDVSMANDKDEWLVSGMRDLKPLRVEQKGVGVDLKASASTLGVKHFQNHTYISLDNHKEHLVKLSDDKSYKKIPFLISANAKLTEFKNGIKNKRFTFDGHVDLKLNFNIPQGCKITSIPEARRKTTRGSDVYLEYFGIKKAVIDVYCR